jgi:hypothetical protein
MSREDEFSPQERELLAAWTVERPPADLVDRALTRRARRMKWIGAGAALAAAVVAAFAWMLFRGEVRGSRRAVERETIALGGRAIAVLEAGTELAWVIDRTGRAELEQRSGNVFYRVERGGEFIVHTPRGDVRVLGTCFRAEVEDMMASSAGLIGAGIGAALAATVVVTVYEGKVVTASPDGEVVVAAGEAVALEANKPVKKRMTKPPEAAVGLDARALAPPPELPEGLSVAELYARHRALAKEAFALKKENAAMREQLTRAEASDRMYDFDAATLQQMAAKCELRWDMQPLKPTPQTMSAEDVDKMKMSEEERATVDRVLAEDHQRLLKGITALYVEVTGDAATGSLAPGAMFEEIVDKAPKGEIQRVFFQLSHERAGLLPAGDPAKGSAWERAFRMMVGAGDALEASLVKELGPDTARALRDLHGGWMARTRSTAGCPEGQ